MALTRDKFIKGNSLKLEKVSVPEFGKDEKGEDEFVWIQELSGEQRVEYNDYVKSLKEEGQTEMTPDNTLDVLGKLVVLCAVDDNRKPIFTDEDIVLMKKQSTQVISRLGEVALRISGVTKDAIEEAKRNLKNAPKG